MIYYIMSKDNLTELFNNSKILFPIYNKICKKLYKSWWYNISVGGILVIPTNPNEKAKNIKEENITLEKMSKLINDENIKYLVWSAQSMDALEYLVYDLFFNRDLTIIDELLKENPLSIISKHPEIFFEKEKNPTQLKNNQLLDKIINNKKSRILHYYDPKSGMTANGKKIIKKPSIIQKLEKHFEK